MLCQFYYLREKNTLKPIVTICLLKHTTELFYTKYEQSRTVTVTSKGIAICHPDDLPNKKVGRKLAKQRALAALRSKKTCRQVTKKDTKRLLSSLAEDNLVMNVTPLTVFKVSYIPILTPYEQSLLNLDAL